MLNDRIVHTYASATKNEDAEMTAAEYDDLKLKQNDDFDFDVDDYNQDEMEDEVGEDIPEMELLAMMDAEEDSLLIARRLFKLEVNPETLAMLKQEHLEALYQHGFVYIDGLVDLGVVAEARRVAGQLSEAGDMTPAALVRMEDDPFRDRKARDDVIMWLHRGQGAAVNPALDVILEKLEVIQRDLGQAIKLKGGVEIQLAVYKGNGGHYERHRDAFPVDDEEDEEQRRVTVVVYLTDENELNVGGGLKVFRPLGSEQTVDAVPGRVMIFLSGVVDHEVLPVYNMRAAVSAWMR